eukprot:scpid42285/ scgid25494/ 
MARIFRQPIAAHPARVEVLKKGVCCSAQLPTHRAVIHLLPPTLVLLTLRTTLESSRRAMEREGLTGLIPISRVRVLGLHPPASTSTPLVATTTAAKRRREDNVVSPLPFVSNILAGASPLPDQELEGYVHRCLNRIHTSEKILAEHSKKVNLLQAQLDANTFDAYILKKIA